MKTKCCGVERDYSDKYDAYYCPKCFNWLEKQCSDNNCGYCKDRPLKQDKDRK